MHELGIIENIFRVIEEVAIENSLTRVKQVNLKIGKLRQVIPDMLEFAFENVAKGTLCEGAKLFVESIPILMECQACQSQFQVLEHTFICPDCDSSKLTMLSGNEVVLDNLEGEV